MNLNQLYPLRIYTNLIMYPEKMVPQIDPAALHLYGISKEESVTKNIQVESDLFKSGEPNEFPKEAEPVDYSKGQEELILR